jgi:LacI family transcriptional regulator
LGYPITKQLLERKQHFTALFAYNDISAIGAIWALREAGLRVPEDVSIVGFDDIPGAAFANPGLTTVRQPLLRMGEIAAQTLVSYIEERQEYVPEIAIEPEFVIRDSTARPVRSGVEFENLDDIGHRRFPLVSAVPEASRFGKKIT